MSSFDLLTIKSWRFFHKWLAIGVGIFIISWTLSGIIMVLPEDWFNPAPGNSPIVSNFREISISPQEAIIRLETSLGQPIDVVDMGIKRIIDKLYYWMILSDGTYRLVDSKSGQLFEITPTIAVDIARDASTNSFESIKAEALYQHTWNYPFGKLPVYRIVFADSPNINYYVNMKSGDVSISTVASRVQAVFSSLHTFEPVRVFTERGAVRKSLLIVFALVGLLVALTGYILAIQPAIRRRNRPSNKREI